jgi:hypothetical protein
MATNVECSPFQGVPNREEYYSPDILPLLQTLLGDLADLEVAFEKRLDAIKHSDHDELRKVEMIANLRRRHREERAPYIQDLTTLRAQIETTFA